jgi:hypothetical protein
MSTDIVLSGTQDGQRNHPQREQRQKVNGAPRSPGSDRMDEERGSRDQNHESGPGPARRAMRQRALGGQKLHDTETDRCEGESGVKPDDRLGIQQWGERHGSYMPGSRSKSCAESLLGVPFLVRSHVGSPTEDSIGWNVERVDTVHPAKGALRTASRSPRPQ